MFHYIPKPRRGGGHQVLSEQSRHMVIGLTTKLPAHQTPAGQLTPTTRSVKIAKKNHRLPPSMLENSLLKI